MVTKLTELKIRSLQPQQNEYALREGDGFILRVRPSGSKSFYFVFDYQGQRCKMFLGAYPAVSLAAARERHLEALLCLRRGIDPRVESKPVSEPPAVPAVYTVDNLISDYLQYVDEQRSAESKSQLMKKYVSPALGTLAVADVRRRDAIALIDAIAPSKPAMAAQVLKRARAMFSWALQRERCEYNPFAGVAAAVPAVKPVHRDRVLTDAEIKLLWSVLRPAKTGDVRSENTRRALALVLITGQRPGEVSGMMAEELQGEWWTIPADRAKNQVEHDVYLSQLAISLLPDRSAGPIFPAPQDFRVPLARPALSHFINKNKLLQGFGFTPHDLRRTCATRLSQLGCTDEIIDAILNHVKTGVIKIYNRNRYLREKQEWLIRWAEELARIVNCS